MLWYGIQFSLVGGRTMVPEKGATARGQQASRGAVLPHQEGADTTAVERPWPCAAFPRSHAGPIPPCIRARTAPSPFPSASSNLSLSFSVSRPSFTPPLVSTAPVFWWPTRGTPTMGTARGGRRPQGTRYEGGSEEGIPSSGGPPSSFHFLPPTPLPLTRIHGHRHRAVLPHRLHQRQLVAALHRPVAGEVADQRVVGGPDSAGR